MNIKVSIPVTVGGYTGQRDQWEQFTRNYNVRIDGECVVLEEVGGNIKHAIKFNLEEFGEATTTVERLSA